MSFYKIIFPFEIGFMNFSLNILKRFIGSWTLLFVIVSLAMEVTLSLHDFRWITFIYLFIFFDMCLYLNI